jgi:hypothetical protein
MLDTTRREFIALVGGGGLLLAAKVRRARGQQAAMPWAHSAVSPIVSIWVAKASSLRNRLLCASAIQNSRMLVSVSRCNGSSVILIARSQSAAFSHGST